MLTSVFFPSLRTFRGVSANFRFINSTFGMPPSISFNILRLRLFLHRSAILAGAILMLVTPMNHWVKIHIIYLGVNKNRNLLLIDFLIQKHILAFLHNMIKHLISDSQTIHQYGWFNIFITTDYLQSFISQGKASVINRY